MVLSTLAALLSRPRPILLDGAVGTELDRRGIPTTLPLWSAHALASEEGLRVLTEIHADYARAGAEILVTNTFRTTPRALRPAGREADWRELNRRAVACAREAGACLVAGGLAPLEECYSPHLVPPQPDCLLEHRQQAELLADLGVDLLFIETMNAAREAEAAALAARETGLDFFLSLCPEPPCHLLSGEPLAEVVPRLVDLSGPSLRGVLVNCRAPEVLEEVYSRFGAISTWIPHGVYAHLGRPDDLVGWRLPDEHDPERYARWILERVADGARLVGGCCGTTPDHIAAIAAHVR